jgi:hypothetical protein
MMGTELTRERKTTTDSGRFTSLLDTDAAVCPDPKDCPVPEAPLASVPLETNVVCPDPKDCPVPEAQADTGAQ